MLEGITLGNTILAIVTGFVSSITASVLFLCILYKMRPSIKFSPHIADQSSDDDSIYVFKIINKSKWPVTHIELQLTLITPIAVPGGITLDNQEIKLIKNKIFELGKFSKKDKEAHYALRMGTHENISGLINTESQYLYLTVSARHGFTGFSKVFNKYYYPNSDIKTGKHEFGENLLVQ